MISQLLQQLLRCQYRMDAVKDMTPSDVRRVRMLSASATIPVIWVDWNGDR